MVYSQGLWWTFWGDGSNIDYSTSAHGISWSKPTVVTSNGFGSGANLDIYLRGASTIYYVLTDSGVSDRFFFRYGILNLDGTISWSISEQTIHTRFPRSLTHAYGDSITVDNSGTIWAAVMTYHPDVQLFKSSDGITWTRAFIAVGHYYAPTLLSLQKSGGVAMLYGATEDGPSAINIVFSTDGGSSWVSLTESSDFSILSSNAVSLVSPSTGKDTIYFAGLSSQGTVDFWSYQIGTTSISNYQTLFNLQGTWSVSISGKGSNLIVAFGAQSSVYSVSSSDQGTTWSVVTPISTTENNVVQLGASTSINGAKNAGVVWRTGLTQPFTVRFSRASLS